MNLDPLTPEEHEELEKFIEEFTGIQPFQRGAPSEDVIKLKEQNKELKRYIIELEEMLGCAAPRSYCDSCSCGKKEALENETSE